MTGLPISDSSDGIWDDGEWISWDWINRQIHEQDLQKEFPTADPEVIGLFEDFVGVARNHKRLTGNYLQVWGELGELYASIKYGIKRHKPKSAGSDGRIGNDFIEVKTISPEKSQPEVQVKRTGNFNKLLVVKISETFQFESRIVDRKQLGKSTSPRAKITWDAMAQDANQQSPSTAKPRSKKTSQIDIVVSHLAKLKTSQPRRKKTLLGTLRALFKKQLSQEQLSDLLEHLCQSGIVIINGNKVDYKLPATI